MTNLDSLDAIDKDTSTEDRVCITRDHDSKEIAWRFGTSQMSPYEMIQWAVFYSMFTESGYRKRIEELEKKVEQLEKRLESV